MKIIKLSYIKCKEYYKSEGIKINKVYHEKMVLSYLQKRNGKVRVHIHAV